MLESFWWPPLIPLRSRERSRDWSTLMVHPLFRSGVERALRPGVAVASYHINISTAAQPAALEHLQDIDRDGPFTEERYGEVAARGHANIAKPGRETTRRNWRASDAHERAKGNTHREC